MDEIERLLVNWGRWAYDDHRTRKGVSDIQIVLNRLKLYGGKGSSSEDDRAAPTAIRTQIDEAEAMRIDKAICALPSVRVDDKKAIKLLQMVYITWWVSFPSACRQCGLSTIQGRESIKITKERLSRILEGQELFFGEI